MSIHAPKLGVLGDLSAEMEYSLISTLQSTSLPGSMSYELLILNIGLPVHAGRDPKNIQTIDLDRRTRIRVLQISVWHRGGQDAMSAIIARTL